jgi:hypothetical protein
VHRLARLLVSCRCAQGEQLHGLRQRQRRELEHDFTVEIEPNLARAQDPQRRGGVEQAQRERRDGVEHVLTVVEDHHRGGGLEPLDQRRLASRDVQRGDHRVEDVVRGRRAFEPGEPDPTGRGAARLGQPAPGGDRDGGLADSARPDDLDQPVACEQLRCGSDVRLAADELDRQRRQVPGARVVFNRSSGTFADAEGRVLDQDPSLELLQPGTGGETELLREQGPDPLVGGQCVVLASRPVERGDQQLPQAFVVGIGLDGGLEVADQVPRPAEPQARRELGLGQLHARLVEPRPVHDGPVAGFVKEIAPVALKRRRAQLEGGTVIAGVQELGGSGVLAQDSERVDLGRIDREPVSAVCALDHVRIAERSSQLGDLRLQRVAARGHRSFGPHVLHEPVGADERPSLEREAHEQLRGLSARHQYAPAVALDRDGAQYRDVDHVESLRSRCGERAVSAHCQRLGRWWRHVAGAPPASAPSPRRR